jgi:hypothetical protein
MSYLDDVRDDPSFVPVDVPRRLRSPDSAAMIEATRQALDAE